MRALLATSLILASGAGSAEAPASGLVDGADNEASAPADDNADQGPAPDDVPGGGEEAPAHVDDGTADDAAVPEALPPLDDDLEALLGGGPEPTTPLANPFGGVDLIAYGRIRGEVDAGRGVVDDDPSLGLALTGRLGAEVPLDVHRARIVLGDGRRFGPRTSATPTPFLLEDALGFIYALSLTLDVPLLGLPGTLRLGRQEVTVGDGRWVGPAPFDPRGRPLDGTLYELGTEMLMARAGAFYLGPYALDTDAEPSALGVLEARFALDFVKASVYLLEHRDGTLAAYGTEPLNLTTAGGRAEVFAFGARGWAGVDGQLPIRASAPTAPPGFGAHGELGFRYAPELELFDTRGAPVIGAEIEATGGIDAAGKTFRAPAPNPHLFLGRLDLVSPDNVASAMAHVGLSADQLEADLALRVIALTDPAGALYDAGGARLLPYDRLRSERLAYTEVDASLLLRPTAHVALSLLYAVAVPGPAIAREGLIHRLWVGMEWALGDLGPTPL